MPDSRLQVAAVREKLAEARNISILTHINPDADTLGTGLGIYALLTKERTKRVEIVNASPMLPRHLDFLPNFSKIKHTMDFEESLIISCDCGSIDRLGFDLEGRDILNIDHHAGNAEYGSLNVVLSEYASASQVAYALFKEIFPIDKSAASCFYTALLSDTQYFTTSSVDKAVFETAGTLVALGADPVETAYHLTQRRSLASLRILHRALGTLTLHQDAQVATLFVTNDDLEATGATMPDMDGIVDYARSLATVEIGIFALEQKDTIRVSLRSKSVNVSALAAHFGGGGHKVAAGFTVSQSNLHEILDIILKRIEKSGLIHGKK